jgi:hypothetical protein
MFFLTFVKGARPLQADGEGFSPLVMQEIKASLITNCWEKPP